MGELPSNLGYVCCHGSCGASATQLRHKCDANLSVICISPASPAACMISCGASALPHVRCAHEIIVMCALLFLLVIVHELLFVSLLTCMYICTCMACNDCVRLSHNEHVACYKSVHSIRFVSLLPHFASHCNTGEARMKMDGLDEEGMSVAAKAMGELPSNLGYVCCHGSCGASATKLRHKCDANVSVICISPASAAACIISCGASALPHVRCAHE